MSNNQSIQILRGTRQAIYDNRAAALLEGQPLYNTTDNYLTVGTGSSEIGSLPIVVREVKGYWDDNNGIASEEGEEALDESNGVWHLGPDTINTKVEFKITGKPLSIVTDNSSIVENAISNSLTITHGDDSNTSNKYWKIYDDASELNILGNGQRVHIKSQNVNDATAILIESAPTKIIDLKGGRVVLHVKSTSSGTEQIFERSLAFTASSAGVDFGSWSSSGAQDNFYGASKRLIDKPSLTASGDAITVTAGGQTSSAFTVPFATKASSLLVGTNTYYTFTKTSTVPLSPASGTIYLIY